MTSTRAWLALLRPPNLLTVPGDVCAGYFLAMGTGAIVAWPELAALVLAGLFFYAAGLLLNDWADFRVDRAERPERPLPSGAVSRRRALAAAAGLLILALGLCLLIGGAVWVTGLVLAACVVSYNLFTKRLPLIGSLNMAACRGVNFLLGAVLVAGPNLPILAWWGLGTVVCYMAAVTHLARREMTGRYWAVERWLPSLVLVAAFFVYLPISKLIYFPSQAGVAVCFAIAAGGCARVAGLLPNRKGVAAAPGRGPPVPTPALIGRLISFLLPIQAACIVGSADGTVQLSVAVALLALWPLHGVLAKRFYSS